MPRKILLLHGHPDPSGDTFGHALATAYAGGAEAGGHALRRIDVATLDFELLRRAADFRAAPESGDIREAQEAIAWADHLVIVYPLWLGTMPALMKAFLEAVFCGGFAASPKAGGLRWEQNLKGKSARIVVTMGMPAFAYRWFFRAHSLKSLERNILRFGGVRPVRESLVGMVERGDAHRRRWLARLERLGRAGR